MVSAPIGIGFPSLSTNDHACTITTSIPMKSCSVFARPKRISSAMDSSFGISIQSPSEISMRTSSGSTNRYLPICPRPAFLSGFRPKRHEGRLQFTHRKAMNRSQAPSLNVQFRKHGRALDVSREKAIHRLYFRMYTDLRIALRALEFPFPELGEFLPSNDKRTR